MIMPHSMNASPESSAGSRPLNTPEFIDRLATELRSHGDVDLPHSYYVEQVKIRLAGDNASNTEATERQPTTYESSDCFRAWALGE